MTEQERDALLGRLEAGQKRVSEELAGLRDDHGKRLDEIKHLVDAVDNGLQDLRRDLEQHGMLPPVEQAG